MHQFCKEKPIKFGFKLSRNVRFISVKNEGKIDRNIIVGKSEILVGKLSIFNICLLHFFIVI